MATRYEVLNLTTEQQDEAVRAIDALQEQCHSDSERWFPTDPQVAFTIHMFGLCGEVGEVHDDVKKILRGSKPDNEESWQKVAEEMTDVFIYLLNLARQLNFNLAEVYFEKRDKNERRFGEGSSDSSTLHDRVQRQQSSPLGPSAFVPTSEV